MTRYPADGINLPEFVPTDDEEDLREEYTRRELYEIAQDLDIKGRSTMDKDELARAVEEARGT